MAWNPNADPGYYDRDYDEQENKRHSMNDQRRNWRKKTLLKESDHSEWEDADLHRVDHGNLNNVADDNNIIVKSRNNRISNREFVDPAYKFSRHMYDENIPPEKNLKSAELYEKSRNRFVYKIYH